MMDPMSIRFSRCRGRRRVARTSAHRRTYLARPATRGVRRPRERPGLRTRVRPHAARALQRHDAHPASCTCHLAAAAARTRGCSAARLDRGSNPIASRQHELEPKEFRRAGAHGASAAMHLHVDAAHMALGWHQPAAQRIDGAEIVYGTRRPGLTRRRSLRRNAAGGQ